MSKSNREKESKEPTFPELKPLETCPLSWHVDNIRITSEWMVKNLGNICDLDLTLHFYDERARFREELTSSNRQSEDGSAILLADIDRANTASTTNREAAKIDLSLVDATTSAILFFIDGGSRNFANVDSLTLKCNQLPSERESNTMAPVGENSEPKPIFSSTSAAVKSIQGVVLCVLYRDGWHSKEDILRETKENELADVEKKISKMDMIPKWAVKSLMEPVVDSNKKSVDEKCLSLAVNHVPSLEKFRPRLFNSVRDICAALSSTALPRLKKKFQKSSQGLEIIAFTEVLFKQLYESFPKIILEEEAAYTVAMIQEMFHQIDYNGDMTTDWDEFTTFCIQNGMVTGSSKAEEASENGNSNLDEYVIEYAESMLMRDRVLSMHRFVSLMRFVPQLRRILVIPDDSDCVLVFDESFKVKSQVYPGKIQILGDIESGRTTNSFSHEKCTVYDILYLPGKDMYALTTSDRCIIICKEKTTLGGKKTTYFLHNKIFNSYLHLKLCWSEKHNILCSVASDKTIYGWDVDRNDPIFQISRHSDIITDFLSCDQMDCFITCSMDRKIVIWSATTRRVKGVLSAHKRGVRSISNHENLLLSSGFDLDAYTWDLVSKDPIAILRGHRRPIVMGKLMCTLAKSDKDYRAITVDEGGEFRLWNIYLKEKTSEPVLVPTLQIFEMTHPENPLNEIRFFDVVNNPTLSTSYYSNLVACSTKLMNFIPEKNSKEFMPPTRFIFIEPSSTFMTCNGPNFLKYDICAGEFICSYHTIHSSDLTAIKVDGERGRRCFIGCQNGDLLLVNCLSGSVIDVAKPHSKEITGVETHLGSRNNIYTCSLDGKIKLIEESGGKLHSQNSIENAFGENVGVAMIKVVANMKTLIAASVGNTWGMWNYMSFKKTISVEEHSTISAIEVLGTSKDESKLKSQNQQQNRLKELTITFVVLLADCAKVYTFDVFSRKGVTAFLISYETPIFVTNSLLVNFPMTDSVNYSKVKAHIPDGLGKQLVVSTDDGQFLTWDMNDLCEKSEAIFKSTCKEGESLPYDPNDVFQPEKYFAKPPSSSRRPSNPNVTSSSDLAPLKTKELTPKHSSSSLFLTDVDVHKDKDHDHMDSNRFRMEFNSTYLVVPASGLKILKPNRKWTGHLESISHIVSMEDHGCFASLSFDGFHRIWNADLDCLGQMPLPNLSEKMKNAKSKLINISGWKFVLERIPASKAHQELAQSFVNMILQQKQGGGVIERAERRTQKVMSSDVRALQNLTLPGVNDSWCDNSLEEENDHAKFRNSLILSINEPIELADDAPPTKVLSKEERKMAQLAASLESKASVTNDSFEGSSLVRSPLKSAGKGSVSKSLSQASLWTCSEDLLSGDGGSEKLHSVPPAFSEASLANSMREGWIDGEGYMSLVKVGSRPDKVSAYDRSQPMVVLRNPAMSLSFEMPATDSIKRSEIEFGAQKDMYKNAEKVLNDRNNLNMNAMRNAVALSRIDLKAAKIKTMVTTISQINASDENLVSSTASEGKLSNFENETDKLRTDEQKMRLRLLQSAALIPPEAAAKARPLDRTFLTDRAEKLKNAVEFGPEWEAKFREITSKNYLSNKKKKSSDTNAIRDMLERKLAISMKEEFASRREIEVTTQIRREKKKALEAKDALTPSYKLKDVEDFMDTFAKVDEDFSGDLLIDEWCKLFASLKQNISPSLARSMFFAIDKNNDGRVSIADLVPIYFNRAKPYQLQLIVAYATSEIIQKNTLGTTLTPVEMEQLFEAYDTNNVGFVDVGYIRERIRTMQLPPDVQFAFMDSILEVADEDMLSPVEFARIFRAYIADSYAK